MLKKKMKEKIKGLQPQLLSLRRRCFSSTYLLALFFILFVSVVYLRDFSCIAYRPFLRRQLPVPATPPSQQRRSVDIQSGAGEGGGGCDIYEGEWVYDEAARPLYAEEECPYIQPQLTCLTHGRPDTGYQHWRWQPRGCALPAFDARLMLERLRGKRVLFVGDSLNRGQFVSLVCLLHRDIPDDAKSIETNGSLTVFTAKEYNATVEFYWAPFLAESNSDDAVVHRIVDRVVRADSIHKHAQHWKGADVLVLNTYLWWRTGAKIKILQGSFEDDEMEKKITEMVDEDAFRLVLTGVVRWLEKHMNPRTTSVFFVTMSPTHARSVEWGGLADGNCYNETEPIRDPAYWGSASSKGMMRVVGEVFGASALPVRVVNVTQLSEYRKDAHTQIYKKQWRPLTAEQLADPKSYADCIHWCLPGLQDTWNELLYAELLFR